MRRSFGSISRFAFTPSASTSPRFASVYCATHSTNSRSDSGKDGKSSTSATGFSRRSGTPASGASSHTAPTTIRGPSGTRTSVPGASASSDA